MERIDEHVGWLREGWAALYVVITNKAEDLSLRKDCRVFVDRSIPKMKDEPGCDDITVNFLRHVAGRNAHALQRA